MNLFRKLFFTIVITDQRKRKLESIEKEDDINTALAKLVDQAADLNIQQFKYAIEIKVKLHWETCLAALIGQIVMMC